MSRNHRRLNQRRWAAAREAALDRDRWACVRCGAFPSPSNRLEVDHIIRLEDGGAEYDQTNLQTLCADCHRAKTRRERGPEVPGRDAWRAFVRELLR